MFSAIGLGQKNSSPIRSLASTSIITPIIDVQASFLYQLKHLEYRSKMVKALI